MPQVQEAVYVVFRGGRESPKVGLAQGEAWCLQQARRCSVRHVPKPRIPDGAFEAGLKNS